MSSRTIPQPSAVLAHFGFWLVALTVLSGSAANAQTVVEGPDTESDVSTLVLRRDMAAIRALGEGVLPELAELYRGGDEDLRAKVANVWYGLGWRSEEAKDLLLADFATEHVDLRLSAQWAAGRVSNDPAVMKALVRNLLLDPNALFRDKAGCALAHDQIHLDPRQRWVFYERIITLLEAPSKETRSLAIRILRATTGQTKGYRPLAPAEQQRLAIERWREWLDEIARELEDGPSGGREEGR